MKVFAGSLNYPKEISLNDHVVIGRGNGNFSLLNTVSIVRVCCRQLGSSLYNLWQKTAGMTGGMQHNQNSRIQRLGESGENSLQSLYSTSRSSKYRYVTVGHAPVDRLSGGEVIER